MSKVLGPITSLRYTIGLKKLSPFSHPIKSKLKTNRDSLINVFPAFFVSNMSATSSFDWLDLSFVTFAIGYTGYFTLVCVESNQAITWF